MARTLVLVASLALIALLLFLTLSVMLREGVTFLVVVSLGLLAVLGFGVIGALASTPPDD
ncbi:MAG TPA: hypothetical protein VK304_04515 [Thermoleophilaceae bacterium]|nr:hypothetical protein [Thermoleophilaceae bacterium]